MAPTKRTNKLVDKSEIGSSDFLSSLPLSLLTTILSLLTLKEAVRTSILSSSWRHHWKSVPLWLDDSSLNPDNPRLDDSSRQTACNIIRAHMGPIEFCNLSKFDGPQHFPTMNRLLQELSEKKIRHLSIEFNKTWRTIDGYYTSFAVQGPGHRHARRAYKVPLSFLLCETLQILELYCSVVPENIEHVNLLPNVKEINLDYVFLNDDRLFSCPNLEIARMHCCCGPKRVHIWSRKLRELEIIYTTSFPYLIVEEIFIEDAPSLEVFKIVDTYNNVITKNMKMKIQAAPNLVQLALYCYLGDAHFKHADDVSKNVDNTN